MRKGRSREPDPGGPHGRRTPRAGLRHPSKPPVRPAAPVGQRRAGRAEPGPAPRKALHLRSRQRGRPGDRASASSPAPEAPSGPSSRSGCACGRCRRFSSAPTTPSPEARGSWRSCSELGFTGDATPPEDDRRVNGFVVPILKEEDWTSHDAVHRLRTILGVKEIGHAGSLDPFATGVLVCGVGRGTKILSYLMDLPKEYVGTIRLGIVTDTGDVDGRDPGATGTRRISARSGSARRPRASSGRSSRSRRWSPRSRSQGQVGSTTSRARGSRSSASRVGSRSTPSN